MHFQQTNRPLYDYDARDTGVSSEDAYTIYNDEKARFFQIKSASLENVLISYDKFVWATSTANETKFTQAFENASYVIFLFSVNESRQFCGYSVMQSRPGESIGPSGVFMLRNSIYRGQSFDIQWIRIIPLPFDKCNDLKNPLNFNKPVWVAKDGQEIDRNVGRQLCEEFEKRWMECCERVLEIPLAPNRRVVAKSTSTNRNIVQELQAKKERQLNYEEEKRNHRRTVEMVNEVLKVFPIDTTEMTYETYQEIFQKSQNA